MEKKKDSSMVWFLIAATWGMLALSNIMRESRLIFVVIYSLVAVGALIKAFKVRKVEKG